MAKTIKINSFTQDSPDSFRATGTVEGKAFVAKTILWGPKGQREPIFKVFEASEDGETHLKMAASSFSRGERISIARHLKLERIRREEVADVTNLTVKELRQFCKERGVSGAHAKGVRKNDLVKLAASA
jgi:hypothetical protein